MPSVLFYFLPGAEGCFNVEQVPAVARSEVGPVEAELYGGLLQAEADLHPLHPQAEGALPRGQGPLHPRPRGCFPPLRSLISTSTNSSSPSISTNILQPLSPMRNM